MTEKPAKVKGPASYFPSIEKTYGRPVAEWQALVRARCPARHMDLVAFLKQEHGMGHGHANAIVAATLAEGIETPDRSGGVRPAKRDQD